MREQPVFVGREPELARLDGYLDAALAGQGQVAFVVGGPGRGKTALLRAFAERAMAAHPDLLVVGGRATPSPAWATPICRSARPWRC